MCTCYWPDTEESKVYGSFHVMKLKEATCPHYIVRQFLVHHDSSEDTEERHVYHFHFKNWHVVPLTAPISVCDQFRCNFVCFYLKDNQVCCSSSTAA